MGYHGSETVEEPNAKSCPPTQEDDRNVRGT